MAEFVPGVEGGGEPVVNPTFHRAMVSDSGQEERHCASGVVCSGLLRMAFACGQLKDHEKAVLLVDGEFVPSSSLFIR